MTQRDNSRAHGQKTILGAYRNVNTSLLTIHSMWILRLLILPTLIPASTSYSILPSSGRLVTLQATSSPLPPSPSPLAGYLCVPKLSWSTLTPDSVLSHLNDLLASSLSSLSDISKNLTPPSSPKNKLTSWLAEKSTAASIKKSSSFYPVSDEVFVWSSTFSPDGDCYGSSAPIIRARGIVPFSPSQMANLLMDSSQVKSYNKMSLGRTDSKQFDENTKIVYNRSSPPITRKIINFTTLMAKRELPNGVFVVLSRAVDEGVSAGPNDVLGEIILGLNVMEPLDSDPSSCMITTVNHVTSEITPGMFAHKLGVSGATKFIKDIRLLKKSQLEK